MGLKSVVCRIRGQLKNRLQKLKNVEKDKYKTLYKAHARMYWNLYQSRLVENALNVGDRLPIETLQTVLGSNINFSDVTKQGPLVIAFFRGSWCAYCSTEVNYLQENMINFEALGATVIAISPQSKEHSKSMIEAQNVTFPVVSDSNNAIAKKFGLTYALTNEVVQSFKDSYQIDLQKFYGKDVVEVPLPATYVIDSRGVIVYAYIEEDHRKRADVGEVLLAASRCKLNRQAYIKKSQECDLMTMCLAKKMLRMCKQKKEINTPNGKERRNSDSSSLSLTTTALYYCLDNEEYLDSFKEFLAKTYCVENLLFYFDSRDYFENYSKMSQIERKTTSIKIYENYIKAGSELEVNIDDITRENIIQLILEEKYQKEMFENANGEVFKLLETDSFHKWRRTKEFHTLWRKNGSPSLLALNPF